MKPEPRIDAEALLAHADWMRALAFSLLRDPAAADDVVQDATVAALLHAPADDADLGPWLSRVVRNFAFRRRRGEARRAEHESRAMPSMPEPSPAETLERLDLQRTLVEAVRTIDEPLRTTLVMRYFEGHSCADIARAQRVPAGTVRWRLSRALDELRQRLDARMGSRENWVALMVPFAGHPIVAPPPISSPPIASPPIASPREAATTGGGTALTGSKILTGVLAMKAAQLVATAAALVILGGIAWWSFGRVHERPDVGATATGLESAISGEHRATDSKTVHSRELESEANTTRASIAAQAALTPEAHAPAAANEDHIATVEARFVDEHGAPWSDVHLMPRKAELLPEWKPSDGAISGADGRVHLRLAMPAWLSVNSRPGEVQVEFAASRAGCSTIRCNAMLRPGATAHLGDVVLGPGVMIRGRALDENGVGVGLATIGVAPAELSEEPGYMRRQGSTLFSQIPSTRSAADGTFTLEGVAPASLRLWAHAEGKRYAWTEPIAVPSDRDLTGLEVELTPLLATDRIAGRIVGPNDELVSQTLLSLFEHRTLNASHTMARVNPHGRFDLLVGHDDSTYDITVDDLDQHFASTTLEGIQPGSLDVVIRLHEKRSHAIHLRDAEGGPIVNARFLVSIADLGGPAQATSVTPGDYSISVPDGKFTVEVSARGFRSRSLRSLDAAKLPAVLDVVLQRAPSIHGRVLADGVPIGGARVLLLHGFPNTMGTISGLRYRYRTEDSAYAPLTDAEGRFRLDCEEDHGFWLRATAAGWAVGEVGPLDATQLDLENEIDIVLTKGGAIEGHVLLPDGRDGEGSIIAFNHGDGAPRTQRAGPKGFYHVDGLAPGKWQVLPAESEIDPMMPKYSWVSTSAPIEWSCEVSAGRTTRFDLDLSKR